MNEFLKVTIEKIKEGATYEGTVYDYDLEIITEAGDILKIFDYNPPISDKLSEGKKVELVIVICLTEELHIEGDRMTQYTCRGVIEELNWRASRDAFRKARPELFEHGWLRLRTPAGVVLMSTEEAAELFWSKVDIGSTLAWKKGRLDLYAIV